MQKNIACWQKKIDKLFLMGKYNLITVHQTLKTKEINNFQYELQPEILNELVSPPLEEEIIERNFIINRSLGVVNYLIDDVNSRQAAFVNNYDGADNHCIAYIHHYIRNDNYSMNVYIRSLNYISNFVFDNQTFNLAYQSVFNVVKKTHKDIEKGVINVFVFSMHIYV
jgi:hypothetical protein